MNRLRVPFFSYGTLYGTAFNYDPQGNLVGSMNLTGWGIFFEVKNQFDPGGTEVLRKWLNNGITLDPIDNGTAGRFLVTWSSQDMRWKPGEYFYTMYVSNTGTVYSEGTTQLKSIGSGIFEITRGVKFGTT
jgi:hypothetical protein